MGTLTLLHGDRALGLDTYHQLSPKISPNNLSPFLQFTWYGGGSWGLGRQDWDSWATQSCDTGSNTPLLQPLPGVSCLSVECGIYRLVGSAETENKMYPTEELIIQAYVMLD